MIFLFLVLMIRKKYFFTAGFNEKRNYTINEIKYEELVLSESQFIESIKYKNQEYKEIRRENFKKLIDRYLYVNTCAENKLDYYEGAKEYGRSAVNKLKDYLKLVHETKSKINIVPFYLYYTAP